MAKQQVGTYIDENLYKAFKLQAVLEDKSVAEVLALAMLMYLNTRGPMTIRSGYVKTYLEQRKAMQAIEEI